MAAPGRERSRFLSPRALGVLSAAAGLAAARCTGGACSACLGCAVPALAIVATAVLTGRERGAPVAAAPAYGAGRDVPPAS
jgi:hypothetical protein